MKNKSLFFGLVFFFALSSPAADLAPGEYNLLPSTEAHFSVRNFGFTSVDGKFAHLSGKLTVADILTNSKVTVDINTESIDTANTKRDEHLRSADFFKVSEFPKMSFVSQKITGALPDFKIEGTLTIAGVANTEILDVHLVSSDAGKLHLTADTTLDRSNYKMISGASISNTVKVHLDVQAEKSAASTL